MTQGYPIETKGELVRFTMSKEAAESVKQLFTDMSKNGAPVSYLDCVLFDAALDVLGIEKEYYGVSDEEWEQTVREREEQEKRYGTIRTIDVTDTWREVM